MKEIKKIKWFGKCLIIIVITILYLVTFFWVGHMLYYLSKVFKIIGHAFMLEFASAKDEFRMFWKHYTNLRDL